MQSKLKIHNPPLYTAAASVYPYSKALELHFLVQPKYAEDEAVFLAKKVGDYLHVPRELAPLGEDRRSRGSPIKLNLKVQPRDEKQVALLNNSMGLLKQGKSHTIQALMGFGKSYCGTNLLVQIGLTTLIIVTKEDLMIQWRENLLKYTDIKPNEIGIVQQNRCDFGGNIKVTIAMVHSLAGGDYPSQFYDWAGLVLVDECFHPDHELLTPNGWVSVKDITDSDSVMSFDANTDSFRFETVLRTVCREFNGNLVNIEGRTFHTLTTPNHEQPIKRGRKDSFVLDRSTLGDINLQSNVQIPSAGFIAKGVGISQFNKLQIAFEADGTLLYTSKTDGLYTYRFSFRRERKIFRLKELLASCSIEFTESINARGDTSICFKETRLLTKDFSWFDPYISSTANSEFLEELIAWDGWTTSGGGFWTHEELLRTEFILLLAKLCGRQGSITQTKHKDHIGPRYRVHWSKEQTWLSPKGYTKYEVPYSGNVYCVTVPSGNVLTRYNGKLSITGNCHRISANWFVSSMFRLNSYLRLGLTATPKRTDGKDYVFKSHLGDIGSRASNHLQPPKVLVIKSGWKIPKWKKRDPETGGFTTVEIPHKPGRMASVVKAMGMDDARNHLIADLCLKAYQKDRKIVIFFEQIDGHLKKIRPILVKMGIPSKDISEYIGGLTDVQRVENAKARVILGSYSYFSEGTDIPDLDTAILASPRSNVMQAIGRILRVVEGKKEPVIFDIVDESSAALVNMHHSRMRSYNELKANVVRF